MFKIFLDPVVLLYSKIVILYYYIISDRLSQLKQNFCTLYKLMLIRYKVEKSFDNFELLCDGA